MVAACSPLLAQPKPLVTGLLNPSKLIQGPQGTLLVTEFGDTANTGRVSVISSSGTRRTLIDGLPSGVGDEGPDGPTGILLDDNDTLFVAIGEGDQLAAGPDAGTQVPNPKGPASPILATILQINLSGPVDRLSTGFSLKTADHATLADGLSVTLDNGAGDKATVSMLSEFRYRPDPNVVYKNSHPYALAKTPGDANHLYLVDAGLNSVVQIDLPSGKWRKLAAFPPQPNKTPVGPPVYDAVPDSIRAFGGKLIVTLLSGFPFTAGNSKVMAVDPATGQTSVVLDNLTSSIDVAFRTRFFGGVETYVLEFSNDLENHGPGRLRSFANGTSTVVADNLPGPSSMVLDGNTFYIATKAGIIFTLDVK
jgi:hypothetical protein